MFPIITQSLRMKGKSVNIPYNINLSTNYFQQHDLRLMFANLKELYVLETNVCLYYWYRQYLAYFHHASVLHPNIKCKDTGYIYI